MKKKVEKFICNKCGLQEAEVDDNDLTRCPNCNELITLAAPNKERIRINIPRKNQ